MRILLILAAINIGGFIFALIAESVTQGNEQKNFKMKGDAIASTFRMSHIQSKTAVGNNHTVHKCFELK